MLNYLAPTKTCLGQFAKQSLFFEAAQIFQYSSKINSFQKIAKSFDVSKVQEFNNLGDNDYDEEKDVKMFLHFQLMTGICVGVICLIAPHLSISFNMLVMLLWKILKNTK